MADAVRINPTGEDCYIPDDRRTLTATPGLGNTGGKEIEVFLVHADPAFGEETNLGWYRLSDLQLIIDTYKNGFTL